MDNRNTYIIFNNIKNNIKKCDHRYFTTTAVYHCSRLLVLGALPHLTLVITMKVAEGGSVSATLP